ncbi:E3 ubiquitin-protein ligase TRIM56-like [Actinia tenebrosa]|uniref:E3 ubiquitin-protein ligase TRIM56-like n=1 Tax=Actinia tenebrosa TaxID=6105 RepID=A0A6P8IHG7_ACTTE|nr:E3 ubiquitin-protein ligase TRIM56-like [Actinia tenebrosa]
MASLLENLKKDVQCSLCNDRFIEPKILSCFHTFCKLCIEIYVELTEKVFKCPKCKSKTPLPYLNSVEDLEPSLLHSRMVKVLEFVENEKVCSVTGSHPPASWHCFECNRSLCDECEKNHSVFIKDHKIVSLVEIKEGDVKLMLSRETNCVEHVDKIVELFCKDCEEIICLECLKHDHEGHSTITLSKYAKSKSALLSDKLEQLKIREQTMEKKFKAMQEVTEELKESGEKEK